MKRFPQPILKDSVHFTPQGRRLLAAMGAIERDPLLVEAERWLLGHQGPMTEAVREVRRYIGPQPVEQLRIAAEMRGVK